MQSYILHGYGGDGKDISMLTLNWKRFLKNTVFKCPNGHEKCEINPIRVINGLIYQKIYKYILRIIRSRKNN